MNDVFKEYKNNSTGLILIDIFQDKSDSEVKKYKDDKKSDGPAISGTGGGSKITQDYGINGWPTVILIEPSKKVVEKDLYPEAGLLTTLKKYPINNQTLIQPQISAPHLSITPALSPNGSIIISQVADADFYTINLFSVNGSLLYSNEVYLQKGRENVLNLFPHPVAYQGFLLQIITPKNIHICMKLQGNF